MVSLDVLRGATVALMILVNNAGGDGISYRQLRHSVWNGCTLADTIFPMFLFIVGASMAIALPRRLERGDTRAMVMLQVLKRAALIALVGLALNALPLLQLGPLRVYGVLQRIALCYLLAGIVFLYGRLPGCIIVVVAALMGYWLLLRFVPVPGYGVPGVSVGFLDPHGNLAAWLDRTLVPAAHLYHHGFYDPEGLLSTLPALATTLLGTLSLLWLRATGLASRKIAWLCACGVVLLCVGLLWGQSYPLNKRLWTSSFVLFNAGLDMVLLGLLYACIDCRSTSNPTPSKWLVPWLAFGSNALTAYVLSEVLAVVLSAIVIQPGETLQQWFFRLLPASLGTPAERSLIYSLLFVAVCFVPVIALYRRRIFIKL